MNTAASKLVGPENCLYSFPSANSRLCNSSRWLWDCLEKRGRDLNQIATPTSPSSPLLSSLLSFTLCKKTEKHNYCWQSLLSPQVHLTNIRSVKHTSVSSFTISSQVRRTLEPLKAFKPKSMKKIWLLSDLGLENSKVWRLVGGPAEAERRKEAFLDGLTLPEFDGDS